jgi:aryl-alcohol dehydrogenase-like predicted oxidoreductase
METRPLGKTGQQSTVAVFGTAAFWEISQADADQTMEQVIAAGINHIDVAPQYGQAQERLGPWMATQREQFFLGCKTLERQREAAWADLQNSLEVLKTDHFDLYQAHAVGELFELDEVTRPGGAIEALLAAREQGMVRWLGITGHGLQTPRVFLEALNRYPFDTVMLPLNLALFANLEYRTSALELLEVCHQRGVGVLAIKALAHSPWRKDEVVHTHNTWYRPLAEAQIIQQAVNFVLSLPITAICTPGDTRLLPMVLAACERFSPLQREEQQAAITSAADRFELIFND